MTHQHIPKTVVIGVIRSIEAHPDTTMTKVQVTKTDIGNDTILQVLCGATNIYVGMIVPVAMINTQLTPDFTISKRSIKGVDSEGMLCSRNELGLTDDGKDGIYALPESYLAYLGMPLCDVKGDNNE